MHPRILPPLLLAVLATGCSEAGPGPDDGGGDIITAIDLDGAGFTETGVDGFGGLDLPNTWTHMFGSLAGGDQEGECLDLHRCGVGGAVDAFGLLTGEDGKFAVVTTGNFLCLSGETNGCDNEEVAVIVSGVQSLIPQLVDTDDGQEWTGASLLFRYAVLSALENPAGSTDSVVVRVQPTTGSPVTVLRLTAGNLGQTLPLQGSTCGTQPLPADGGIETTYPACSERQDARVDITDFIGQEVTFQFVAGEAGAAIAIAFDNVRIELSR